MKLHACILGNLYEREAYRANCPNSTPQPKKNMGIIGKKHVEIQIYKSQDVQQIASLKNMYTPEN